MVAVGPDANVAGWVHGLSAEGTDLAAGGDHGGDFTAEDAALTARKEAVEARLLRLQDLDGEQVEVLGVADADLDRLELEVDSVAEPAGDTNPHGNAWRTRKRHLTSESQAQRLPDQMSGRAWLVASADTETALGARPAYKIEPGAYTPPLWQDGSEQAADVILWATGFRPAVDHLRPLKLREPGGGILVDGTRAVREPRLHLVGYGPSASTIGASRAAREAVREVLAGR